MIATRNFKKRDMKAVKNCWDTIQKEYRKIKEYIMGKSGSVNVGLWTKLSGILPPDFANQCLMWCNVGVGRMGVSKTMSLLLIPWGVQVQRGNPACHFRPYLISVSYSARRFCNKLSYINSSDSDDTTSQNPSFGPKKENSDGDREAGNFERKIKSICLATSGWHSDSFQWSSIYHPERARDIPWRTSE